MSSIFLPGYPASFGPLRNPLYPWDFSPLYLLGLSRQFRKNIRVGSFLPADSKAKQLFLEQSELWEPVWGWQWRASETGEPVLQKPIFISLLLQSSTSRVSSRMTLSVRRGSDAHGESPRIKDQGPPGCSFSKVQPSQAALNWEPVPHRDLCSRRGRQWSYRQATVLGDSCCQPCSRETQNLRSRREHMFQPLCSEPPGPRQLGAGAEPKCVPPALISSPTELAPGWWRFANEHTAYLCSCSMSPFPTWRQLHNPPVQK